MQRTWLVLKEEGHVVQVGEHSTEELNSSLIAGAQWDTGDQAVGRVAVVINDGVWRTMGDRETHLTVLLEEGVHCVGTVGETHLVGVGDVFRASAGIRGDAKAVLVHALLCAESRKDLEQRNGLVNLVATKTRGGTSHQLGAGVVDKASSRQTIALAARLEPVRGVDVSKVPAVAAIGDSDTAFDAHDDTRTRMVRQPVRKKRETRDRHED